MKNVLLFLSFLWATSMYAQTPFVKNPPIKLGVVEYNQHAFPQADLPNLDAWLAARFDFIDGSEANPYTYDASTIVAGYQHDPGNLSRGVDSCGRFDVSGSFLSPRCRCHTDRERLRTHPARKQQKREEQTGGTNCPLTRAAHRKSLEGR